jgi:hypothetical protein
MGVKTTMAGLTFASNHLAASTTKGQCVASMANEIQLVLGELINDMKILVGSMQAGDPNIATLNAQITALS